MTHQSFASLHFSYYNFSSSPFIFINLLYTFISLISTIVSNVYLLLYILILKYTDFCASRHISAASWTDNHADNLRVLYCTVIRKKSCFQLLLRSIPSVDCAGNNYVLHDFHGLHSSCSVKSSEKEYCTNTDLWLECCHSHLSLDDTCNICCQIPIMVWTVSVPRRH